MKTILNKLPIILIFLIFQFCKTQNRERYISDYNKNVPKLQQIANLKQQFYGDNFSNFLKEIENKGAIIDNFSYRGVIDYSPKIKYIVLNFTKLGDYESDYDFQKPCIIITMQDQVPDELRLLTLKYHGELTQEVRDFLANRKIEKIEFYGINGLTSTDRSSR